MRAARRDRSSRLTTLPDRLPGNQGFGRPRPIARETGETPSRSTTQPFITYGVAPSPTTSWRRKTRRVCIPRCTARAHIRPFRTPACGADRQQLAAPVPRPSAGMGIGGAAVKLPDLARVNGFAYKPGDLILSPNSPMDSAKRLLTDRYTIDASQLLYRHRGGFYCQHSKATMQT